MTPKLAPIAQPGARVAATPYARRLARERGIPLSALDRERARTAG